MRRKMIMLTVYVSACSLPKLCEVLLRDLTDGRAVKREKMLGAAGRNFVKMLKCFSGLSYTGGSAGERNHRCFFISPEGVYRGSNRVLSLLGVISPICFLLYRVVFHRVLRVVAFLTEGLLPLSDDLVASKFYFSDVLRRAFLKVFAPRGGRSRARPHMTSSFSERAFLGGGL